MEYSLNNKSYSIGMATLAACGGIISNQASATIIATDIDPDVFISNSRYDYDINADGINDFYLDSTRSYGSSIVVNGFTYTDFTYSFTGGGYNGNQIAAAGELNYGDTVDASLSYSTDGLLREYSVDYTGSYVTTCYSRYGSYSCTQVSYDTYLTGDFTYNGYLGLALNIDGETYYGWSELYTYYYGNSGILRSYAYENWAGEAIQAGYTYNENTVGAQPSVSVPEPSMLMLLSAGFAGLTIARRRKQNKIA